VFTNRGVYRLNSHEYFTEAESRDQQLAEAKVGLGGHEANVKELKTRRRFYLFTHRELRQADLQALPSLSHTRPRSLEFLGHIPPPREKPLRMFAS